MAANIFTKGMLCLAFAAALTGCGPKSETPANDVKAEAAQTQKVDFSRTDPSAAMWRIANDGESAAVLHYNAYKAERNFRAGKISQEEFNTIAKTASDGVAGIRAPYVGTNFLNSFDQVFADAVRTKDKVDRISNPQDYAQPQAGQLAEGATGQSLIAELIKMAAGQMAEDLKIAANAQAIGPASQDPALQGISTRQSIFPGGPLQYQTVLDGSALKPGGIYNYTGKLTINGDVPENTTLNVDGKLVVSGNVAGGAKLSVKQPENTRPEKYDCWNWAYGASYTKPSDISYHYGLRDDACTRIIPDGLKYKNDPEAAIHITGSAANNAGLYTNGGKIAVDGGRVAPAPTVTAPQPATPAR
ncbi:MAG: hypothetical protein ACAH80_09320 [Alphaproteobacteria bacterium]